MTRQLRQGDIVRTRLDERFAFEIQGFGPCIVLLYMIKNSNELVCGHFDETERKEILKCIKEMKTQGTSSVIVLGGRESDIINPVIKDLKRKKIRIYSENAFSLHHIHYLFISNSSCVLRTPEKEKTFPFKQILEILNK